MLAVKIFPLDEKKARITGSGDIPEGSSDPTVYIGVSDEVYKFVCDNIEEHILICPRNVEELKVDMIEVKAANILIELKHTAVKAYKNFHLGRVMDPEFLITFIDYTMLNNKFCSHGFFITQDNKEEMYLDILNTGDMSLIESLERYLNVSDKICEYWCHTDNLIKFKEEIYNAESREELEEIYKRYCYGQSFIK